MSFAPRQILASALCENDTLSSLDLSYNAITQAAAMVLAFALKVKDDNRVHFT